MNKISNEVALAEFDRFVDEMGLLIDPAQMDAEDKTAFEKQKARIVDAIEKGHLVINENGEAVYTPHRNASRHKEPITFHERTGASVLAMDGKKKNQDMAKTYAIMAEMCKVHPSTFASLAGPDIKVCEAIYALLMD